MNPLDVFLSSLLKWVLATSAVAVTITGITCAIVKAVKKGKANKEINKNQHYMSKKEKRAKKYEKTGRLISTPHKEELTTDQVEVKVGGERGDAINNDKYLKESSGVLSSIQDPKLAKLIEEYVLTSNPRKETEFTKVKISHVGESSKKCETLIAPKRFVESLFIPKVCYECAVQEDQKFPVVLTYQSSSNIRDFSQSEPKQLVIESKQAATEYALEYLTSIPANLSERAGMDMSKLADAKTTTLDSSK